MGAWDASTWSYETLTHRIQQPTQVGNPGFASRRPGWIRGMVCYAAHGQQYRGDQHFDGTSTPWDMKIGNVWHKEI